MVPAKPFVERQRLQQERDSDRNGRGTHGSQEPPVLLHGEVAVRAHALDRHDPSLLRLQLQFD